jgi:hypothetical protein
MSFLKKVDRFLKRIWDGRYLDHETRNKLRDKFGARGYWYPLTGLQPPNTEYFEADVFLKEFGEEKTIQLIKTLGDLLINEIGEAANDRKIPVEELSLDYDETFYCNVNVDWIIYRSHERTITLGGQCLTDELKKDWGEWEKFSNPWKNY